MAEVQKAGGSVALIDAEHAFDPVFAKVGCLSTYLEIEVSVGGADQMRITRSTCVCQGLCFLPRSVFAKVGP